MICDFDIADTQTACDEGSMALAQFTPTGGTRRVEWYVERHTFASARPMGCRRWSETMMTYKTLALPGGCH